MLSAMRSGAQSWVVKVLLGFLVMSFALWGIGDVFLGGGSQSEVASVDGKPITIFELEDAFEGRIQQVSQLGATINREQAISFGLMGQALNDLMLEKMVERHAEDLGLSVSDQEIAAAVRANPAFGGVGGFDRQRFELFMRSRGLTEEAFLAQVKGELLRDRLLRAFGGIVQSPAILNRTLGTYRNEERKGRLLVIDPSQTVPEPATEEELQAYLSDNQVDYMVPELRQIDIIILDAEKLSEEVEISDAAIAEAYEERKARLTVPATRTVDQLLAGDRTVLEDALNRLAEGQAIDTVLDDLNNQGLTSEPIGPVEENEFPEPLNSAIFAANDQDFGAITESAFGFHSFRLTEQTEERVPALADIRASIERDLALTEAQILLPDLARGVDDEIGAGQTLGAAAEKFDLPFFENVEIDSMGRDVNGESIVGPRLSRDMLVTIFSAEAAQVSLLEIADDDRQYVFIVDSITDPAAKPLADVRDQIENAVNLTKQSDEAQTIAEDLLASARETGSIDGMDGPEGLSISDFGPLTRSAQTNPLGLDLSGLEAMFGAEAGAVGSEIIQTRNGPAIFVVDEVIPAASDSSEAVSAQLRQGLQADLLLQYSSYLQNRYPSEINQSLMAQLMQPQDQLAQ